ncbi:MAG TPA: serine/threonine-protein kinase [Candidatus Udaeobacter sp.]|nr:serine/threonine-protein kinase [Candidatus Udaeobacter sp.]
MLVAEQRAEQVAALFKEAIERDESEWEPFLQSACAMDAELRSELESLLVHHRAGREFLEETPEEVVGSFGERRFAPGDCVQHYRIESFIGDGGMGIVYLAEDMRLHRRVALKLVNAGFGGAAIIRHFRKEQRILASLNHQNVACLYDAGVTEDGQPFFAMEYVDGTRLDDYCEENHLSIRERLTLFRKVCGAVAYAHQHLVIHRDIKPGNIRVTKEGEPMLLDFGIAKLLDPATSLGGEQTLTFARALTPEYASPEQVRGEAIATTSDVYSLGVILYKLLTGHSPYRTKTNRFEELARAVTDQEPDRPSTVLKARNYRCEKRESVDSRSTPHDSRLLRGDLDNIVLRAMRKESHRRYQSAAEFSEDIRRHLAGLPVTARKDTWSYRAAKFVGRNQIAVGAGALVLIALLGGIVATAREGRAARQEKARAESINSFLEQLLNYSNPQVAVAGDTSHPTTVTEAMDEAAKRLENGAFIEEPEVRADLERIVAESYAGQGKRQLADEHIQKHLALATEVYGKDHPKTLAASATRAKILFNNDQMVESEKLYRQLLPRMRAEQQKGDLKAGIFSDALNNFGYLRRTQGDSHEAELLFRESLALTPQIPTVERDGVGITRSTLASALADQGKFEEAFRTAQEAVSEERQMGQADTPGFGFSLTVLGGFLTDNRQFPEADAALREAEAIFRKLLSPSHLWLADNLRNQAALLYEEGRFAESLEKVSRVLELYRQNFGTHYDNYPTALIICGLSLAKTGQPNESEAVLREAVKIRTDSVPKEHFWVALANDALGECLTLQGRYDEAEPLLIGSYESLKFSQGAGNPRTRLALQRLIALYDHWGKHNVAKKYKIRLDHKKF